MKTLVSFFIFSFCCFSSFLRQWIVFHDASDNDAQTFIEFLNQTSAGDIPTRQYYYQFHPMENQNYWVKVQQELNKEEQPNYTSVSEGLFIVEVSEDEFFSCNQMLQAWNQSNSIIHKRSCADFLQDISVKILEIKPPTGTIGTSKAFVSQLKNLNAELERKSIESLTHAREVSNHRNSEGKKQRIF